MDINQREPRKPGLLDLAISRQKQASIQATYGACRESKVAVMVAMYGGRPKGAYGFRKALMARFNDPLTVSQRAHSFTEHGFFEGCGLRGL